VPAPRTCLSFSALILLPILRMTCAPMHSASVSYFHRWWTSAAPSGIPSLSFNTLWLTIVGTSLQTFRFPTHQELKVAFIVRSELN